MLHVIRRYETFIRFLFQFIGKLISLFLYILVCLRNLNDHGNALLAFERSVMLPDALKNPLIYLNFAIHCWQMKLYDMAQSNLNNFFSASEQVAVRHEVS